MCDTMKSPATRQWLGALLIVLSLSAAADETEPTVAVKRNGDTLVVDATLDVPASADTTWEVLTDFEHMAAFYPNLKSSGVLRRDGDIWIVRQEDVADHGLLSLPFESVLEMRLEPKRRILARNLSGTLKRMESEATITPVGGGVELKYHAEVDPDSLLARVFGTKYARREVGQQLTAMAREMIRRQARALPPVAHAAPAAHG
jgi:hypothetical protein